MQRKKNNISVLVCLVLLILILFISSSCNQQEVNTINGNVASAIDSAKAVGSPVLSETNQLVLNSTERSNVKIKYSGLFVTSVVQNNLSKIDITKIQTLEEFGGMVDKFNILVELSNINLKTSIHPLLKDVPSYEKYTRSVERYTPLVEDYNAIIDASYNFHNDDQTANILISKLASFGVKAGLIFTGILHDPIYSAVGDIADAFGITSLAGMCSTCVSVTMSSMYWTGKDYVLNVAGRLTEKAIK